ncbi:DUF1615 family protein [Niveibacterium terrae]|uniref:DUF1615 family protein n=1 Tax=Niveibacterium terrae TaxID=3373598 RepID=UPI003A8CB7DE
MSNPLFRRIGAALLPAVLAGCATQAPAPIAEPEPEAAPVSKPASPSYPPLPELPREITRTPLPPVPAPVAPRPATPRPAPFPGEQEIRAAVLRRLPARIADRAGWAAEMQVAFSSLRIPPSNENLCSAMAVIEQESSWQGDPVVPGLGAIVWREMYEKAAHYAVPKFVVDLAMLKTSPNGVSYRKRVDSLRTEREMNRLYEDMVAELPDAARALGGKNPIKTGGPMQVSVDFAEALNRERPYPYAKRDTVRHEVFTRRGGLYYGIAMLLDYPAVYSSPRYRFADFNAGRYSSRNAAFQRALASLSARKIDPDGDLLRYDKAERPLTVASDSEKALASLASRLGMSPAEIRRDLLLEKVSAFSQTPLWQKLFALADRQAGKAVPREAMPRIELKSPKIHRKLTTEWFADRVWGRYQACMSRSLP